MLDNMKNRGRKMTKLKERGKAKIDSVEADRVYNSEEVAKMLQCCPVTVRRMIKKGFLKGKKTGQGFKVLGQSISDYLTE
jgi:hypothetical protein